jgi:hypothetical protein
MRDLQARSAHERPNHGRRGPRGGAIEAAIPGPLHAIPHLPDTPPPSSGTRPAMTRRARASSSGGLARVVAQQPAEPRAPRDRSGARAGLCAVAARSDGHHVPQALMRPLGVVVLDVVRHHASKVPLTQDDEVIEALGAHQAHEALGVRVEVGTPRRQAQWPHAARAQNMVPEVVRQSLRGARASTSTCVIAAAGRTRR